MLINTSLTCDCLSYYHISYSYTKISNIIFTFHMLFFCVPFMTQFLSMVQVTSHPCRGTKHGCRCRGRNSECQRSKAPTGPPPQRQVQRPSLVSPGLGTVFFFRFWRLSCFFFSPCSFLDDGNDRMIEWWRVFASNDAS